MDSMESPANAASRRYYKRDCKEFLHSINLGLDKIDADGGEYYRISLVLADIDKKVAERHWKNKD